MQFEYLKSRVKQFKKKFGGLKADNKEESILTFASVVGQVDKFSANEDVEEWFTTSDVFLEVNGVKKDSKKALQ